MRLGINVSRYDQAVKDALLELRPAIIVAADPVDWGIIAACKAAFDCLVIYRPVVNGDKADNAEIEPDAAADWVLAEILGREALIDAVQFYNEVINSNNVDTQGPRELAFVRLMQAQGIPVVALNPGVGNIEAEHVPMLRDVFLEAAAVGYHGYVRQGSRLLDNILEPNYLRRPVDLWAPGHPYVDLSRMILTETGTYFDPPKTGITDWTEYARLLIDIHEYAMARGMKGTAAFTLAGYEPWITQQPWQLIDHPDALAVLVEYNRTHDGPAPRLTTNAATRAATTIGLDWGITEEATMVDMETVQEEATMLTGADLLAWHQQAFNQWWDAGGWRHFAGFLLATGQETATDAEKRDIYLDGLESGTKDAAAFLRSLPL